MKTGIYFLLLRRTVVYIGQTKRFPIRPFNHNGKIYDSVRFIECATEKLNEYEMRLIKRFKPVQNINHNKPMKVKVKKERVKTTNKAKFSLYMDKSLMEKIAKISDKKERSVNYVVEKALCSYFDFQPKES